MIARMHPLQAHFWSEKTASVIQLARRIGVLSLDTKFAIPFR